MAKYSKIERVEPLQSRLATAVEGNWKSEKWEYIEEVKRRTEKLRREVVERVDEGNSKRVQKGIAYWDKQNHAVPASNCVLKVQGEII